MKLGDSKEVLYICGLSRLETYIGDSGIGDSLYLQLGYQGVLAHTSSPPLFRSSPTGSHIGTLSLHTV